MASNERAIINNLNERARHYGGSDAPQLTIYDVRAILDFYERTCLKCGNTPATSIDHVKPLSKGGENSLQNAQVLCVNCNKAKGDEEIDYRNGKVCPADFTAPTAQNKRIKHDWDSLRFEYETNATLSLRELARKQGILPTLLFKRSASEGWHKSKEKFGSDLVATAENEVINAVAKQTVEKELSARALLFDVIESAVEEWQNKPRASLGDLAQLLKLGMAAQGQTTERTEHVESTATDTELFNRIYQAFDAGEEETGYSPLGDSGEEYSTGWSD
jgi:hypothetical protein